MGCKEIEIESRDAEYGVAGLASSVSHCTSSNLFMLLYWNTRAEQVEITVGCRKNCQLVNLHHMS